MRHDSACDGGTPYQGARLSRVHRAQGFSVERRALVRRGLQIEYLAADHSSRTRSFRDDADHPECSPAELRRIRRRVRLRVAREQCERFGQQPIPGENGHRFAMNDVRRRTSAPHGVVVHRGEVVVDQGVRVDQFDRARRRHREPAGILRRQPDAGAASFCRGEDEHRPQALAPCEEAVAHGSVQAGRDAAARPKMPIQLPLDTLAS